MSGLNLPVVRLPVPEIPEVKVSMSEFLAQATAKSSARIQMKLCLFRDLVEDHLTEVTGCRYRVGFRRSRGSKTPFSRFLCFWPCLRPNISESRIRNGMQLHSLTRLFELYIRLRQHFHVAPRPTEVSAPEVDPC